LPLSCSLSISLLSRGTLRENVPQRSVGRPARAARIIKRIQLDEISVVTSRPARPARLRRCLVRRQIPHLKQPPFKTLAGLKLVVTGDLPRNGKEGFRTTSPYIGSNPANWSPAAPCCEVGTLTILDTPSDYTPCDGSGTAAPTPVSNWHWGFDDHRGIMRRSLARAGLSTVVSSSHSRR
jgi:hypothetical protein